MTQMPEVQVLGTEEVRQRISALLDELREDPDRTVVIGRHRRPEAVLIPYAVWEAMASGQREPHRPVLGQSNLGNWTQADAVTFEVAEDLLGDLIGWCNARMWEEREKPNADQDPDEIEKWKREAARYVAEKRALAGADPAAVARVIREYGPLVRDLYGRDRDR